MGPKFGQCLSWIKNYIFFTNNSLVMIFYIFIGPGCYLIFMKNIYLPYQKYVSDFYIIFGHFYVLLGFWSYYKASTVDPGVIDESNNSLIYDKYSKYIDEVVYFSNHKCRTCLFNRPARSKHCSLCNKCISLHDHHCIWIRGCVGEKNYKYFVLFIFSHSVFCLVGFLVSYQVIKGIIIGDNLFNKKFFN